MIKSKTNIDVAESNYNIKNNNSFNDFNLLNLKGAQDILSFGEYSAKNSNKDNKRKVINYFYKKIRSKL